VAVGVPDACSNEEVAFPCKESVSTVDRGNETGFASAGEHPAPSGNSNSSLEQLTLGEAADGRRGSIKDESTNSSNDERSECALGETRQLPSECWSPVCWQSLHEWLIVAGARVGDESDGDGE
jgi:hypothetical protein